jgi:hypothetical protein
MKIKTVIWLVGASLLAGCELLSQGSNSTTQVESNLDSSVCLWSEAELASVPKAELSSNPPPLKNCQIEFWLRYWSMANKLTWAQRKSDIEELSNSPTDVLKKIFLSQGVDTPYQDRLRAQIWLESLTSKFTKQMSEFMQAAVYQPSQQLLEMESSLVTLSRINTKDANVIEQQQALIEEQTKQIEQLLNIEASIIDGEQGEQK